MSFRAALAAVLLFLSAAATADVRSAPPSDDTTTFDTAGHDREIRDHARFLKGNAPSKKGRTSTLSVSATEVARQNLPTVTAGDVISVRATGGQWTVDQRKIPAVGIAGHVTEHALHRDWGHMRLIHTLPFGRLLVRVGDGPWLDAGRGVSLQTFVGGPLQFSINDNSSSYGDNAGAITLEVTIGAGPPLPARGPSAPPPKTTPSTTTTVPVPPPPPLETSCPDSLCAAGERCVLHQVQCVAAPCPPQPMCVDR